MEKQEYVPQYNVATQQVSTPVQIIHRRKVNTIAILATVATLSAFVLLCVGVGTNYWYEDKQSHSGLWMTCNVFRGCVFITPNNVQTNPNHKKDITVYIAMRAVAMSSVAFTAIASVLLVLACMKKAPRGCCIAAGVLLVISDLLIGAVLAVYAVLYIVQAGQRSTTTSLYDIQIGYSFTLAGVASSLSLVGGILAYVASCAEKTVTEGAVIYPLGGHVYATN